MPVSGYVVQCEPGALDSVAGRLAATKGVEVGGRRGSGLAIAVETPSDDLSREFERQVEEWPGVASMALIYHNFEDEALDPGAREA
jgi:nitrate reductase NapAB chaperone NapD